MSQPGAKRRDLSGRVGNTYALESRLSASLCAQVFKAADKKGRSSVALWVSRHPLNEAAAQQFLRRAEQLAGAGLEPEVLSYGVDSDGVALIEFAIRSGRHILDGRLEGGEAERRWLRCVQAIQKFHDQGLWCGDVCLESFMLSKEGDVWFMGGLGLLASPFEPGSFPDDPEIGEMQAYLSPEQRAGRGETAQSDVFSLALVGVRLMTGEPLVAQAAGGVLNTLPGQPGWFCDLVATAAAEDPAQRPLDASALLRAVIRKRSELGASGDGKTAAREQFGRIARDSGGRIDTDPLVAGSRWKRTALGAVLLVMIALGAGFLVLAPPASEGRIVDRYAPLVFSDLAPAPADPFNQKVQQLSMSDDPLAHESLVRLLREAKNDTESAAVIQGVLLRARRLGFVRSSDLIRSWYRSGEASVLTGGASPVALKLINPALPAAARPEALQRAYDGAAKRDTVQLAAALALDQPPRDQFRSVFVQASKEVARVPDAEGHSTSAIMLTIPEVRALYGSDVIGIAPGVDPKDVQWLLIKVGEQGDPQVRAIASLGLRDGLFQGAQRVWAESLASGVGLSQRERAALVALFRGAPTIASVRSLVASYNPETARTLLAVLLASHEPAVQQAALDGLLNKPIADPYLQSVLDYVRATPVAEHAKYGALLAAVGLSANLSDEDFARGFALLKARPVDDDFVSVLLHKAPPRVVSEVLREVGPELQAGVYLDLLRNPSKEVRLEALKRLDGINDIAALAVMRQYSEDETDEDVRRMYSKVLAPPR